MTRTHVLTAGLIGVVLLALLFYNTVRDIYAAVPEVMLVHSTTTSAITTSNKSQWRIRNGGAWGTASSTEKHGTDMRQVVVKSARFKEEYIFAGLDAQGHISAQTYNGSIWSPTTTIAQLTTTGDSIYRPFDLEYETGSDRAMIVTRSADGADPVYYIWDGSSWTGPTTIDIPTTGALRFIELARNPLSTSTRIAMITLDANADVYGMEWNGSSWSNLGVTTFWDNNAGSAAKKAIDVAYESDSGAAFFAWATGETSRDIYYRRWNGSSFTASTSLDIATMGSVGNWVRLASNPLYSTSTIMLGVQTVTAFELETAEWRGPTTGWGTTVENDGGLENTAEMNFDVGYDAATTSGSAWVAYGNGATLSKNQFKHGKWGTASTITSSDDTSYIRFASSFQNSTNLILGYEDDTSASDDIMWSSNTDEGTTWTTKAVLFPQALLVSATAYFRLDVAPSRFFTYPTYNQASYRWLENTDDVTGGAAMTTAKDQAATTTFNSQPFRLRMLLDVTGATSTAREHDAVLQFATKSGACDTAFSGESFATVTAQTNIAFYNNPSVMDDTAINTNSADPSYLGHTIVNQTYEEINGATTTSDIILGRAGLWDFSLYDNDGSGVNTYCFRMVKRDGSLLNTYTVVPQITTVVQPTISAEYNMSFNMSGAASSTALLTITDVGGNIITAENDLRIAIATSSVNMLWDTTDTKAVFGGTASGTEVTSADVTYEGAGSVLVIPVVDEFDAGDTLTVSGLSFTSFNTATSATAGALGLFLGGSADQTYEATTTQTVAIVGTLTLANHGSSQVSDQWDTSAATTSVHYRYKFTAAGEGMSISTTTFSLGSITGVDASNFTWARLYLDANGNGALGSTSTAKAFLRPNAAGTYTQMEGTFGCTDHWDCVNEDVADDDITNARDSNSSGEYETFNLVNSTTTGRIINVRVVNRAADSALDSSEITQTLISSTGQIAKGSATSTPSTTWTNFSSDWALNPFTKQEWQWYELDSIEAGAFYTNVVSIPFLQITQTWIEVTYCPADCQILYDGTVVINGSSGLINFATSSPYSVPAGSKSYLLELSMTGLVSGDTMNVDLLSSNASTTATTTLSAITPTGGADDVTHAMDSPPSITSVSFNSGNSINLNEGTYKWASTTISITDTGGCSGISSVTAKAYLASTSNSGTLCSGSDLSCYPDDYYNACAATTTGNTCAGGADQTVEYDCGFKFWYVARPTDTGTWASSIWSLSATATNAVGSGSATNTNQTVEINTLSALDVSPATIAYGSVSPGGTSAEQTLTVTNTGNADIDPRLSGTDMTSADDTILVGQQEYSDVSFSWGSGTDLTTSPTLLDITLPPPTATTTAITDLIYWILGVPSGKRSGSYTGTNTIQI